MIPLGFDLLLEQVAHPRDGRLGDLLRHRRTGAYVLWDGRATRSVPARWAAETTGAWLREQREAAGLTQVAYAALLGLAPNTVARMERGELPLSPGVRQDVLSHAATAASQG